METLFQKTTLMYLILGILIALVLCFPIFFKYQTYKYFQKVLSPLFKKKDDFFFFSKSLFSQKQLENYLQKEFKQSDYLIFLSHWEKFIVNLERNHKNMIYSIIGKQEGYALLNKYYYSYFFKKDAFYGEINNKLFYKYYIQFLLDKKNYFSEKENKFHQIIQELVLQKYSIDGIISFLQYYFFIAFLLNNKK